MNNISGHNAVQLGVIESDCVTPVVDHCMTSRVETNRSNEFIFEEEELEDIFDLPTPQQLWSDSDEPIDDNRTNQISQTIPEDLQPASSSFCSHAEETVYASATDLIPQSPTDPHHAARLAYDIPASLPVTLEDTTAPSVKSRSTVSMSRARRTSVPLQGLGFSSQPNDYLRDHSQLAILTGYSDSDVDEESELDEELGRVEDLKHTRTSARQSRSSRPASLDSSWQTMGAVEAYFILNINRDAAGEDLETLEQLVEAMIEGEPLNAAKFREAHAIILQDHGYGPKTAQNALEGGREARLKVDKDNRQLLDGQGLAGHCSRDPSRAVVPRCTGPTASRASAINATSQVQRLRPPSLTTQDQPSLVNQRKRPLTPSAPAHPVKSKKQQRIGPFEMSSDSESEELPVHPVSPVPEKPLSRRLNLDRLKQAMLNNASQANPRLAKGDITPSAIRSGPMSQAELLEAMKRKEFSSEVRQSQRNIPRKGGAESAPLVPNTTANPTKKVATDPAQADINGQQRGARRTQDRNPLATAQNPRLAGMGNTSKGSKQSLHSTTPSNTTRSTAGLDSKATSDTSSPNRSSSSRSAPPLQSNATRAPAQPTRTNQHDEPVAASRDMTVVTLNKQLAATTKSPGVKKTNALATNAATGGPEKNQSPEVPVSSVLKNILTEASTPTDAPKAVPNAASQSNLKIQNGSTGRTARTPPNGIRKESSTKSLTVDTAQKADRKAYSPPTPTPVRKGPDAVTVKAHAISKQGAAPKYGSEAKKHTAGDIPKNPEGEKPSENGTKPTSTVVPHAASEVNQIDATTSKQVKPQPVSKQASTEHDEHSLGQVGAKAIPHQDIMAIPKLPQFVPKTIRTKTTGAISAVASTIGPTVPTSTPTNKTVEFPAVTLRKDSVTLPPATEAEPYFEYTVFQKLWSDSEKEDEAKPTELTGRMLTSVEEANHRAEKLFADTNKQYAMFFPVQFQGSATKRNDNDCMSFSATFAPIDFPSKESHLKIWVERHFVSAHAAAIQTPPQHTPFISKTLFILRLHKLIENPAAHTNSDTEMPSSSDSSGSEPESDSDPNKGKHKKKEKLKAQAKEPKPRKSKPQRYIRQHHPLPCTEVYTTLDAANCAARLLQIEMSHDKDPSSQAKEKWQEQNARELMERVQSLNSTMGGKEGYWRSEFNESKLGGDRFELVVDKVGLCGPRNL